MVEQNINVRNIKIKMIINIFMQSIDTNTIRLINKDKILHI